MLASTGDNTKKIRKPRAKAQGELIGVRLQPPMLDPLDTWIAAQPEPRPSRPEAIRRLLEKALEGK